jgi:hypothetical protein
MSTVVKVTKQDTVEWLAKSIVEFTGFSHFDVETGQWVHDPCCNKVWRSALGVVEAAKLLENFNVATDALALGLLSYDMTKRAINFVQQNHIPDLEDLRKSVVSERQYVIDTNRCVGEVPNYMFTKHMMQRVKEENQDQINQIDSA